MMNKDLTLSIASADKLIYDTVFLLCSITKSIVNACPYGSNVGAAQELDAGSFHLSPPHLFHVREDGISNADARIFVAFVNLSMTKALKYYLVTT